MIAKNIALSFGWELKARDNFNTYNRSSARHLQWLQTQTIAYILKLISLKYQSINDLNTFDDECEWLHEFVCMRKKACMNVYVRNDKVMCKRKIRVKTKNEDQEQREKK